MEDCHRPFILRLYDHFITPEVSKNGILHNQTLLSISNPIITQTPAFLVSRKKIDPKI